MIGGKDIIYPKRISSAGLNLALRMVQELWPNAVVQAADSAWCDAIGVVTADMVPDEFFVYTNAEAADSAEREGVVPKNADRILHVLNGENSATFVVHHGRGYTRVLADHIISELHSLEGRTHEDEDRRPVTRTTRWKCPEGVHDLDGMLDEVTVDQLGEHDGDEREPKGWWAVSIGEEGDIAFFINEADAFRFRLDLINYWLNG